MMQQESTVIFGFRGSDVIHMLPNFTKLLFKSLTNLHLMLSYGLLLTLL